MVIIDALFDQERKYTHNGCLQSRIVIGNDRKGATR